IQMQVADANNSNANFGAIFDTQAGAITDTHAQVSPTGTSASISPGPSGWWIASVTMNIANGPLNVYTIFATSNSATPSYDSNGNPTYSGSGQTTIIWNASITFPMPGGNVRVPTVTQPWMNVGYNVNTFHSGSFSASNVDTGVTGAAGFQWYL